MTEASNKHLIQHIAHALDKYTNDIAFVINEEKYSYGDLKRIICQITASIPFKNERIGIIAEDNIQTYAAILSVLFSGNTYVILHPSYPDIRNRRIISSSRMKMVLGSKMKPAFIGETEYVNLSSLPFVEMTNTLKVYGSQDSYAYIIFTSGSTGEPKGVPISRNNLDAFYEAYKELKWNLNKNDRVLQMFELTFDISVVSFLYPLTIGASVYTVGYKDIKHFKVFFLLETYAITLATLTPSLVQLLSPFFEEISLPYLKHVIVSAEASNTDLISRFQACTPNARYVNLYGPTESTIYCTSYEIPLTKVKEYNGMIAIGKPFLHTEIKIVDDSGKELSVGEKGELLISGPQVMDGYLNDSQKTNEVMVTSSDGKRFYRTGDLCFMDREGDIYYCGRKDHQVKIQGFRIELNEIENAAKQFFKYEKNAIALTYTEKDSNDALALVVEGESDIKINELNLYLHQNLPYYMIPRKVLFLKEFPTNNSNKIDRKKIKELFDILN